MGLRSITNNVESRRVSVKPDREAGQRAKMTAIEIDSDINTANATIKINLRGDEGKAFSKSLFIS